MKWLISIALLLFFSCKNQKKQENSKTPVVQKDTVKQASETFQEDTELLSSKQLLDSLLKKAKYRNLKKIEIPDGYYFEHWSEDSSEKSLLSISEYKTLGLENFDIYKSYSQFRKIHVYAYLGNFNDTNLFLILRHAGDGASASDLWMVDSLGKIIDIQENVAYAFGDMGFITESYTKRLNDSTFITYRKDTWGEEISLLKNTHFTIRKDSFFNKRFDTLLNKELKF